MNAMKTLGAAVVAVGLAAMPAMSQGFGGGMRGGMHGMGPGGGFGLERAATILDLTPAQKTFVEKLVADTKAAAEPITAQLAQGRQEMQAAVKSNNTGNINNIATQQGNLTGQLAGLHGKAMASFYAQLTPEQKAKFDKLHEGRQSRQGAMRQRFGAR
jgi:Spy/CpxP family protein refolding chaperone